MTEATTTTDKQPKAASDVCVDRHPADGLMNLIANLLVPMFFSASDGDITFARLAATETINAYCARNQAGLLAVAQIVAFGLAALGSLSQSMTDDLPLSMTLRLRSNANALNRSAEQNRRALDKGHANQAMARPDSAIAPDIAIGMDQEDHLQEAAVIASVAAAKQAAADAVRRRSAEPPVQPAIPVAISHTTIPKTASSSSKAAAAVATAPENPMTWDQEQHHRAKWAAAIADVASEFTASLPHLPPNERQLASRKAAVMSTSVTALLSGQNLPRPRPGTLGRDHPAGC